MKRQSYKNSKNDYSCLLGQHVGVMLEKNVVVRENKCLNKKLDVIKCQLDEKNTENKEIKGDLENTKFVVFCKPKSENSYTKKLN